MKNFWYIEKDIHTNRKFKVGASNIPAFIPNPYNPSESLAGHGRTPVSEFMEIIGKKERDPAGLAAEMGHFHETKTLELFIEEFYGKEKAKKFFKLKMLYELNKDEEKAEDYQLHPFYHNTEYFENIGKSGIIVHPDLIVTEEKPFLVEAKSARFFATKRNDDKTKGYDFTLREWQGIPLKHYMQMQFQMLHLDVNLDYLALLSDTSDYNWWRVDAYKPDQEKIMLIIDKIIWYINNDKVPKEFIITQNDVIDIYDKIKDDFRIESEEEKVSLIKNVLEKYKKAKYNLDHWEKIEKECKDALSVIQEDFKELYIMEDGERKKVSAWQTTKGYEAITKLSKIKKNDIEIYNYLKEKDLIQLTKDKNYIVVKYKED